jgi:hypothetical protein
LWVVAVETTDRAYFTPPRIEPARLQWHDLQSESRLVTFNGVTYNSVRRFFHAEKEAEGGWHCLSVARSHAVFGLDEAELSLQAATLLD